MKFSKAKIFLFCCISFIAGIAIASSIPSDFGPLKVIWFSLAIFFLALIFLFWEKKKIINYLLIILFLFLGLWRFGASLPQDTPDKIWHYNGQTAVLYGVLSNEGDIRSKSQKLELSIQSVSLLGKNNRETRPLPVSGKVLITTDLYPEHEYGEKLKIRCSLEAPEEFNGFSYDRYLGRYNIYSVCYYPEITKLGWGGNVFYKQIFRLKNKFRAQISRGMGEPEGSLARAIILGDKKGIPDELRQTFSRVGISHVMAISGMHISILSVLVTGILYGIGVGRKYAFYLSTLFLIFYITLIGLPASAMRAGLMGFLVMWALHLGRLNKTANAIVFSAAVLLLINPKLLRSDIGFQLSFLAVMGIVYGFPLIDAWLKKIKIPEFKGVRSIFSITMAAQIFTLPVLMLNFSIVSLAAPVANILVLWSLPLLLITALAAIAMSLLVSSLGAVFFLLTKFIIDYIVIVSVFLEKLPFSYIEIDYFPAGFMVLGCSLLILIIAYSLKKQAKTVKI